MAVRTMRGRVLSVREFFETLPVVLAGRLDAELRGFDARRGQGRLLKLDFGHPETHYEAWHHRAIARFEVGLHFEGAAPLNAAAHGFFRRRLLEVKSDLPSAELEPWDRGWVRLYETVPAADLTDQLLPLAADRLAAYIKTLQPMLDEFWETRTG